MQSISRTALVPYDVSAMFKLVDNVNSYCEFLPWCSDSKELERTSEKVKATVSISKSGVNQSFTTENTRHEPELLEMKLINGPFKALDGQWQFKALDDNSCKITLDLDYEFSNRMLGLLVGPVFDKIANSLVDSFVERAHECYGAKS